MTDDPWDKVTDEGRLAFKDGAAREANPYTGRMQAAWANGWHQEFIKTPEAIENEHNALAMAVAHSAKNPRLRHADQDLEAAHRHGVLVKAHKASGEALKTLRKRKSHA